jgi:drug/metabolite transporter (DMT)-like permease
MGRGSAAKTSANPQRQGLIAGLLAAVFFGLSAPLISVINGEASPLMIAALLYTGAALALLVVRAAVGRQQAVFTMLIAVLIGREHLSHNGLIAAALIVAGAVFLSEGSLGGTTVQGGLLIGAACLAWPEASTTTSAQL